MEIKIDKRTLTNLGCCNSNCEDSTSILTIQSFRNKNIVYSKARLYRAGDAANCSFDHMTL